MSIIKRRRNGTVQIYLRLTNKQFYLGTEDGIDPDRVYNALSYLWERITTRRTKDLEYYERVGQMLESLLPEEERRRLPEAPQITGAARLKLEAPLISEFLAKIQSLNIQKDEINKSLVTGEIDPNKYIQRLSEIKSTQNALQKRFEEIKSDLSEAMGRIEMPHAGFTKLESFEDLLLLASLQEEMEFETKVESISNEILALKSEKESIQLSLKGLEEAYTKGVIDEREYVGRKSRQKRRLKRIDNYLNKLKASLER